MWGEGGVNIRECAEPPAAVVTSISVAVCSSANRSLQPRNSNTEVKLCGNILQDWSWVIRAPHRALIPLLTGLASSLSLFWSGRAILSDSLCMLQCLCPQGHSSWSLAFSGGKWQSYMMCRCGQKHICSYLGQQHKEMFRSHLTVQANLG